MYISTRLMRGAIANAAGHTDNVSSLSNEYSNIVMYIAVGGPGYVIPQHGTAAHCAHQQPGRPRDTEPFQVCQLCPPRGHCSQRQACSLRGASHACKQDPHQCCRCHAPPLGVNHLHRHLHRGLAPSAKVTVLAASWCLCCCRIPGTSGRSHAADQEPGHPMPCPARLSVMLANDGKACATQQTAGGGQPPGAPQT